MRQILVEAIKDHKEVTAEFLSEYPQLSWLWTLMSPWTLFLATIAVIKVKGLDNANRQ